MERIIISQVEVVENSRIVKDLGQSLTFFDNYILFEAESECSVEDEKLAMTVSKHFKNKAIIDKQNVDIYTYLSTTTGNYVLQLNEVYIGFVEEERCQQMFDKIIKWKYDAS